MARMIFSLCMLLGCIVYLLWPKEELVPANHMPKYDNAGLLEKACDSTGYYCPRIANHGDWVK